MKKTPEIIKYWAFTLIQDLIFYGSLVLWIFFGIENAGNVFSVLLVFVTILVVFVALISSNPVQDMKKEDFFRPRGFKTYHYISDILAILILAWFGHFFLVTLYILKFSIFEGFRNNCLKIMDS